MNKRKQIGYKMMPYLRLLRYGKTSVLKLGQQFSRSLTFTSIARRTVLNFCRESCVYLI